MMNNQFMNTQNNFMIYKIQMNTKNRIQKMISKKNDFKKHTY